MECWKTDQTYNLDVDKQEEHGLASYESEKEEIIRVWFAIQVGRRVDQGLRSQHAVYLSTEQYEGGPSEKLLAGGRVLVTLDFGLSLFCAPCHRTVCGGAGVL